MHILIDIVHAADVNFYKKAIARIKKRHRITVIVRSRGDLVEFAKKELSIPVRVVGRHYLSRIGKLYGVFHRVGCLIFEWFRDPYDLITSFGGFYAGIAGKILGVKSVLFYDNYEYRTCFYLCQKSASKFIIPSELEITGKNVESFYGFKELAYLHSFEPQEEVLETYQLKKKSYIFIRHVAGISIDYWKQDVDSVLTALVYFLNSKHYPIIASIEKGASGINLFTDKQILKQTTSEIHSLMYFSKCTISSGETVAREASLLGVPTLYIGKRYSRMNRELISSKILRWASEGEAVSILQEILNTQKTEEMPMPSLKWEDTTEVILRNLNLT
ncbi:MAG: DUF354 domain-containing protein [Gammaproteobacteria bacterium]|nr:DUF354 domain-containing protein [Gammaproteobacteria bacterium]